ncbi:MAG: hypothetical protein C0425_08915 [Chlorobiaceae bacterium]|nr:hypothetical protein [Chlorobiaceae bacterium]MBA4310443.1 hypothetical protein [Chlorobiaceae bacterium]
MNDWFYEWFESEDYLKVYNHRNELDAKKLFDLIIKKISVGSNVDVLDIACGAGRHSILFSKNGFKVTGVDLSDNLLRNAKKKSSELNLKIEFIKSDIRNLDLKKKFDVILNLFTSFGYFENDAENFSLFEKVKFHLNPKSYFIFDYFNAQYVIDNLVPYSKDEFDDISVEQFRKIEKNKVVKEIRINSSQGEKVYFESVKLYSPTLLIEELKKNGFEIFELCGNYFGDIFDEKYSDRFIAFCKG